MSAYKEFKAKNIDLAIMEACRFFAVDRDSLEIDIVSGGSAGIFGLGAKKAVIRAKRRRLDIGRIKESLAESPLSGRPGPEEQPVEKGPEESSVDTRKGEEQESTEESEEEFPEDEDGEKEVASGPLPEDEARRLEESVREVLTALLRPLCDEARLDVNMDANPITVRIETDDVQLIVGRDGQIIAALQYLANRILSRTRPKCPHVRLDSGDYRRNQEIKLTEMALSLSGKAKKTGKVQSTRPLSSFHRRVVHMALQNDQRVLTRSKGEGAMKRVLILPVRRGKGKMNRREQAGEQ